MKLFSQRFKDIHRLQSAANNNPPLKRGEKGHAIVIYQQALLDLGYPMPRTIRKNGRPDGDYGDETAQMTRKFQSAYNLTSDGIAGEKTLTTLDAVIIAYPQTKEQTQPVITEWKQKQSWFRPINDKFPGLISSIYFPLDSFELDSNDQSVLDNLVYHYKHGAISAKKFHFIFIGNTCRIHSDEYNYRLGLKRANAVKNYVDLGLSTLPAYSGYVSSLGEKHASEYHLLGDRRVDIISSYLEKKPIVKIKDPLVIEGNYSGPLSNKFQFYIISDFTAGHVLKGRSLDIKIKNARTGRSANYTYVGGGPGIGVSVGGKNKGDTKKISNISLNGSKKWSKEVEVDAWLDVDDFSGWGNVYTVTYGLKTSTYFIFKGPSDHGKTSKSISAYLEGWDIGLGFQIDALGYWRYTGNFQIN